MQSLMWYIEHQQVPCGKALRTISRIPWAALGALPKELTPELRSTLTHDYAAKWKAAVLRSSIKGTARMKLLAKIVLVLEILASVKDSE